MFVYKYVENRNSNYIDTKLNNNVLDSCNILRKHVYNKERVTNNKTRYMTINFISLFINLIVRLINLKIKRIINMYLKKIHFALTYGIDYCITVL